MTKREPGAKWNHAKNLSGDELAQLKDRAAERIRWARTAFSPKHSRNFIGSDPRFKRIFSKTRGYSEYKFKEVESGEFGKGHEGFREFMEGFAAFYNVDAEIFLAPDIDQIHFQKMIRQGWALVTEKNGTVLNGAVLSDGKAPGKLLVDWGDGPDASRFYGRTQELSLLKDWMGEEKCRLISLTGMGGIGKTRLAVRAAAAEIQRSPRRFDAVIWRSLISGPSASEILGDWLDLLTRCEDRARPEDFNGLIQRLLDLLGSSRALFILDNVESILPDQGGRAGSYGAGYKEYGRLFRLFGQARHQSCLLLTCREQPRETASPAPNNGPVRTLCLTEGLSGDEGIQLCRNEGLMAAQDRACQDLVRTYRGNPLAIELAAKHIIDVFSGDIDQFLTHGNPVFDDITDILDAHFRRLTDPERALVCRLALLREPVSFPVLKEKSISPLSRNSLSSDLQSLQRRFPLEKSSRGFTLQPVLMEFVTDQLIQDVCREIREGRVSLLHTHALLGAMLKDDVKEAQLRLIIDPILRILQDGAGAEDPREHLREMILLLRERPALKRGYAGGNLINLLCRLGDDLQGCDFSRMAIREADLQDKPLCDVDFSHARFQECTFTRNMGSILSLALNPDGKFLAVADTSREIRIWGLADDQPAITLRGHEGWIRDLAYAPDGRILASCGEERTIRLWDLDTGVCGPVLSGHTDRVQSLAIDRTGTLLAAGSHDQTVSIWDIRRGEAIRTIHPGGGAVYAVAFGPDGRFLAAACQDHGVWLFDLGEWKCCRVLRPPFSCTGPPRALAFSPDGRLLAAAGDDRTISLWKGSTFEFIRSLEGHTDRIRSILFDPEGGRLLSSGEDRTIRIWNPDSGQCLGVLRGHTNRVRTMVSGPDSATLFTGGDDRTIRQWDLGTGACIKTRSGYTNFIRSIGWEADGERLWSCGQDNMVRLWAPKEGTLIRGWRTQQHWPLTIAALEESSVAVTTGKDFNIGLRDLSSGRSLLLLPGHESWVRDVCFTPDGTRLISASDDGTVRIWDLRLQTQLAVLTGHEDRVCAAAAHPDGRAIASGGYDRVVKIWDMDSGRCVADLRGHTGRICGVGFSPDRSALVSAGGDHALRIWDLHTCQTLHTLTGHENWVRTALFSPDGSRIASGSEDGTVRIWRVSDGRCLKILKGHDGWVMCLAYHPRGELLASGGADETIRIWNCQEGESLKVLRSPRPYEGMNIFRANGLTPSQTDALIALGARAEFPL